MGGACWPWHTTGSREPSGDLGMTRGQLGAKGSLGFSEDGIAGSAGPVGCCWVPAEDAGMAEGLRVG